MMLSDWMYRLRALLRRSTVERELEDELRFHIEQETAKYVRTGESPEDAVRHARLALGGLEQTKEECRDARGTRFMDDLAQDLRYAIRALLHNPAFALVADCLCPRHWGEHRRVYGYLWRVVPGAHLS